MVYKGICCSGIAVTYHFKSSMASRDKVILALILLCILRKLAFHLFQDIYGEMAHTSHQEAISSVPDPLPLYIAGEVAIVTSKFSRKLFLE